MQNVDDDYAEYSDDPELEVARRKSRPAAILKFGALSIAAVAFPSYKYLLKGTDF